jgi:hypothetical protein
VARVATVVWTSPPPTSVDELLVIDGDTARLVVRRPRDGGATVGSYDARPSASDRAALVAAGPGPVVFEVHRHLADPASLALRETAERVAAACLEQPRATVTFLAVVSGVVGGSLSIGLVASASGTHAASFELDPEASIVHLSAADGEIAWVPMPTPATGFVTASAIGVGGVGTRARLDVGAPAGTTLEVPDVPAATSVAIEVVGWLSDALPDEPQPSPFRARTPEAAIPR